MRTDDTEINHHGRAISVGGTNKEPPNEGNVKTVDINGKFIHTTGKDYEKQAMPSVNGDGNLFSVREDIQVRNTVEYTLLIKNILHFIHNILLIE